VSDWLVIVAYLSLAAGVLSAALIALDLLAGHRQHMSVMNLVWPITALYAGPLALLAYYRLGRLSSEETFRQAKAVGEKPAARKKPFWQSVGLAATHCGAGCTLGDLATGWLLAFVPLTLFGRAIFADWAVSYVLAFLFGIAFQYFTIVPMKHLPPGRGLIAALKADSLSLTAWQFGMYGWMAVSVFLIFGRELPKTGPLFWFMMQLAMLAGLLTSYPVNWWLIRSGMKERM
jgi:hypothetical protein